MKKALALVPAVLLGVAIGSLTLPQAFAANSSNWTNESYSGMMGGFGEQATTSVGSNQGTSNWGGMMSGYLGNGKSGGAYAGMMGELSNGKGNSMFNYMGGYFNGKVASITPDQATNDAQAAAQNASVDQANNTVTYTGQTVKIVMLAATKTADDKFTVAGLVDPTIRVAQGAKVTMELVNEDNGAAHGVQVTSANPPFAYMSMMQGGIYPGAFIHPIGTATKDQYPTASATFTASQTGTFYYVCPFPGHAAKGMYGKIIVG